MEIRKFLIRQKRYDPWEAVWKIAVSYEAEEDGRMMSGAAEMVYDKSGWRVFGAHETLRQALAECDGAKKYKKSAVDPKESEEKPEVLEARGEKIKAGLVRCEFEIRKGSKKTKAACEAEKIGKREWRIISLRMEKPMAKRFAGFEAHVLEELRKHPRTRLIFLV